MRRLPWALLLVGSCLAMPATARAQLGALIVDGAEAPEPDVLALDEVVIEVTIDHLHATVHLTQVFENRTERALHGRLELALGPEASMSSLALWERELRRTAAVVERGRSRQLFATSAARHLDPALLERIDDADRSVYAVRVDTIAPYERVRIEVVIEQDLTLAGDEALFSFPMAGRRHGPQRAHRLRVRVNVDSGWPLQRVDLRPLGSLRLTTPFSAGQTTVQAAFDREDVVLQEGLMVGLTLQRQRGSEPLLPVLLAHRHPSEHGEEDDERGTFVLQAPLQLDADAGEGEEPQDVVVALDTSLSMRGGKLERAVTAVEGMLEALRPRDRFSLVTFNDSIQAFPSTGTLVPATAEQTAAAQRFFRTGYLSGGTDLLRALPAALERLEGSTASRRTVVLITDGQPSLGSLESSAIVAAAERANDALGASRARLVVIGIGDDANGALLEQLARSTQGSLTQIGESADITPVLRSLVHQLEAPAIDDVNVEVEGVDGEESIYPAKTDRVFDGSALVVYGRYRSPSKASQVRLKGRLGGRPFEQVLTAPLPRLDTAHPWIVRGWARRRVDDLLARIDAEGERQDWVDEVVALAREHLLETPYTSFMATARSLLRPREITPGDPVLRVRTDPSDMAVVALLPFGPLKTLRRLGPGLFETRFLAPHHLEEGRHEVSLVVTGGDGRQRLVRDHFVIDSRPPRPLIDPIQGQVRAGTRVALRVRSDRDTRRLEAFLRVPRGLDAPPSPAAELRWSDEALACVGELLVDPTLSTGTYDLVVVAEDHAHNVGSAQVALEVVGR